jgi:hypothetical protein
MFSSPCLQAVGALRATLLAIGHLDELRAAAVVSHREIADALPALRLAHAKEEHAKDKKKADRKKQVDNTGTPSKGLFGWFGGSGKEAAGN